MRTSAGRRRGHEPPRRWWHRRRAPSNRGRGPPRYSPAAPRRGRTGGAAGGRAGGRRNGPQVHGRTRAARPVGAAPRRPCACCPAPNSRASMRLSISSPIRSTRPSATAESYRGPNSAWAATDALISSRSLTSTAHVMSQWRAGQGAPGDLQLAGGPWRTPASRGGTGVPVRPAPKVPRGPGRDRPRPFGYLSVFFLLCEAGLGRPHAELAHWR